MLDNIKRIAENLRIKAQTSQTELTIVIFNLFDIFIGFFFLFLCQQTYSFLLFIVYERKTADCYVGEIEWERAMESGEDKCISLHV